MRNYFEAGGMEGIEAALEQIIKDYNLNEHDQYIIHNETLPNFATMLYTGHSPDCFWDFISSGSYKECYFADFSGFVFKFATNSNCTEREIELYNAAIDEEMGSIFIPTYVVPLGTEIWGTWITEEEYPETVIDTLVIQPMVNFIQNTIYKFGFLSEPSMICELTPDYTIRAHTLIQLGLRYYSWFKSVVETYGSEFADRFLEFAKRKGISDLNSGNIGWIKRGDKMYPVILDWLSD